MGNIPIWYFVTTFDNSIVQLFSDNITILLIGWGELPFLELLLPLPNKKVCIGLENAWLPKSGLITSQRQDILDFWEILIKKMPKMRFNLTK